MYTASASLWRPPAFAKHTARKATHSVAVKALLDRQQLAEPLARRANGTFKTPAFQPLSSALVASSRGSLIGRHAGA